MNDETPRRVKVLDAAGEPVKGAFIAVEAGTAAVPEIALVSDEAGTVRLPLPRGRFRVSAHAPDGTVGRVEVVGGPEEADREIIIELSPHKE